jgi:hypothetical protein
VAPADAAAWWRNYCLLLLARCCTNCMYFDRTSMPYVSMFDPPYSFFTVNCKATINTHDAFCCCNSLMLAGVYYTAMLFNLGIMFDYVTATAVS